MGKSIILRLPDVRRVFRLLGDCRDLGHDRAAWTRRAIAGLRDELGAYMVAGTFIEDTVEESVRPGRTLFDVGWESDRDREAWLGLVGSPRVMDYGTVRAVYSNPLATVIVRSRDQLVADREWRLGDELNEDRRPLRQDETLIGIHRFGDHGVHQVFSVNRAVGGKRFDGRERAILRLFVAEANALVGATLAVDEAGPFAGLGPRLRQVLDALVEGDSEKQVASRLGLSRHTVHDYVKDLYRRLGVGSRGEMLAYYLRRCRP